jgi:hypothetical protein
MSNRSASQTLGSTGFHTNRGKSYKFALHLWFEKLLEILTVRQQAANANMSTERKKFDSDAKLSHGAHTSWTFAEIGDAGRWHRKSLSPASAGNGL